MKTILINLLIIGTIFFQSCDNTSKTKKQKSVKETIDFMTTGYLLNDPHTSIPATIDGNPDLPVLKIGVKRYHGEVHGTAGNPVVIAIHGGPGADYKALLPLKQLSESNYFVVFYDQQGTGLSPRVANSEISFDNSINELKAIVDHYSGSSRVNIIGHSYGGQLASAFAAKYPNRIDHLILAEPGPLNQAMVEIGPVTGFSAGLIIPGMVAQFEAMHIQGPDSDAADDYFFGRMAIQANPGYWCGGVPPGSVKGWRFGSRANQFMGYSMQENGKLKNLVSGINHFNRSVLFITAKCNTVIGKKFQEEQMQLFPSSELLEIPDSGHEMFSENPVATISAVRNFLGRTL